MEGPDRPERLIADGEVVSALRRSLRDPDTQELFGKWLDQLEAARTEDSLYDIKVSIRRAVIYYKAGYLSEAFDDLTETLQGAMGESDTDEVEKLRIEIRSLLDKMNKFEEIE